MQIINIDNVNKPAKSSIVKFLFFLGVAAGASVASAFLDYNIFNSVLAYFSIFLGIYIFAQLAVVNSAYSEYKYSNVKMGQMLGSTMLYWIVALSILVSFVYLSLPAVQLIDYPYEFENIVKNIAAISDFGVQNSPTLEMKEMIFNFGIFSVVTPYAILSTFILSIYSWLYLRQMRELYESDFEEQEFQKRQRIERNREDSDQKKYKWDEEY